MGLFYVFVKREGHEIRPHTSLAFTSSEVADEWWRAMSGHANLSKLIKRISPQLYIWSPDVISPETGQWQAVYPSSLRKDIFSKFSTNMLLVGTPADQSVPVYNIPAQDTTDLVSGNSFFIRSKAQPHEYWFCPTTSGSISDGTKLYTSREERTRFRVSIADTQMAPGTIMIGTDNVVVSLAFAPNLRLRLEDGGLVADSGSESTLKLADVRTAFASGARRRVVDDENNSDIVVKELIWATLEGSGEGWELV